jgi:hypothetical protein
VTQFGVVCRLSQADGLVGQECDQWRNAQYLICYEMFSLSHKTMRRRALRGLTFRPRPGHVTILLGSVGAINNLEKHYQVVVEVKMTRIFFPVSQEYRFKKYALNV